jgi:hypothetical protein
MKEKGFNIGGLGDFGGAVIDRELQLMLFDSCRQREMRDVKVDDQAMFVLDLLSTDSSLTRP